jgi:hypothetical protein
MHGNQKITAVHLFFVLLPAGMTGPTLEMPQGPLASLKAADDEDVMIQKVGQGTSSCYGRKLNLQGSHSIRRRATQLALSLTTVAQLVLMPPADQIKRTLRSIVLITESILPLNTCLARLRVKPLATWNGTCAGNESA